MTTTIELLDQAKRVSGCETDYQFMKRFSIKQSTMSGWRTGKRSLDDAHAAMIAGILGREPGEVMALCAAERSKDEGNRSRWLRVAALLAAAVLPPAAGAAVDNNAVRAPFSVADLPIMRGLRRSLGFDLRHRLA